MVRSCCKRKKKRVVDYPRVHRLTPFFAHRPTDRLSNTVKSLDSFSISLLSSSSSSIIQLDTHKQSEGTQQQQQQMADTKELATGS